MKGSGPQGQIPKEPPRIDELSEVVCPLDGEHGVCEVGHERRGEARPEEDHGRSPASAEYEVGHDRDLDDVEEWVGRRHEGGWYIGARRDLVADHEDPDEDGRRGGNDESVDPRGAVVLAIAGSDELNEPNGNEHIPGEVGNISGGREWLDAIGARQEAQHHVAQALESDADRQQHPRPKAFRAPEPGPGEHRTDGGRPAQVVCRVLEIGVDSHEVGGNDQDPEDQVDDPGAREDGRTNSHPRDRHAREGLLGRRLGLQGRSGVPYSKRDGTRRADVAR